MEIYNEEVQLLIQKDNCFEFLLHESGKRFNVDLQQVLPMTPFFLGRCAAEDQVLMKEEAATDVIVVYLKNESLYVTRQNYEPNPEFILTKAAFPLEFEHFSDVLRCVQSSETGFSVYDQKGDFLFTIYDFASRSQLTYVFPVDLGLSTVEYRFLTVAKIHYGSYYLFLVYDLFRKEIKAKNMEFSVEWKGAQLDYRLTGPNELEISSEAVSSIVDFQRVPIRGRRVFTIYQLESYRDRHLLGAVKINGVTYYLHNKLNGVFFSHGNPVRVSGFQPNMKLRLIGNNLYLFGRYTHYAYKASGSYDWLYLNNKEQPVAKFIRPFKIRLFRRYGFFKVPISNFSEKPGEKQLFVGANELILHPLKLKRSPLPSRTLDFKVYGTQAVVVKTSAEGFLTASAVPATQEYTWRNRILLAVSNLKKSKYVPKIFRAIFKMMEKLPKKRKLVMFESFHARQYSDNPRAIYEYMRDNTEGYQLVWSIDRSAAKLFDSFQVPYIVRFTWRWFLNYPRAQYWVNNVRLPVWMPKPKGTIYIQTWHGTPLKRLGLDITAVQMPGTKTDTYQRSIVNESRKWDYLVSPNAYSTDVFKRAFHFKGKVIESGYPRNDVLSNYSKKTIHGIKEKLSLPADKKVMLYAPTWRDNEFYQKGKYRFEFQFDLENWKREFGSDWVLLTRMHYLIAENFDFSAHEGYVFDLSAYPDIRDLYLISDVLITDYSSVFFDYAILYRPIIFFMYDLEKYRDQLRGFYINIEEEAPGSIVQTEDELFQAIRDMEIGDVHMDPIFEAFRDKYSSLEDGHAAERVVQAFLQEPDKK